MTVMYNPQIETFIRVADAGSFNKAAQEMFISSTAVTKQMNLLETRLGFRLFERVYSGVRLTKAGKSFYDDAVAIVRQCEQAVQKAREIAQNDSVIIRIGTTPMISAQFLIEMWPEILAFAPGIKLETVELEIAPSLEASAGQLYDVMPAISWKNFEKEKHCRLFSLGSVPIRMAAAVTNSLAAKETLSLEDIEGHEIMILRKGYNKGMDQIRKSLRQMFEDKIHFTDLTRYSTYEVIRDRLEAGALVATIDYCGPLHPVQKLLPVQWSLSVPMGLVYSMEPEEKTLRFLDAVGKVMEKRRAKQGVAQE